MKKAAARCFRIYKGAQQRGRRCNPSGLIGLRLADGAVLVGQLDTGAFQLLLNLGHVARFDVGGGRLGELVDRELPLLRGLTDAAGLLVKIACASPKLYPTEKSQRPNG